MPSWARSLRAVPSGKKGSGLPRRLLTPRSLMWASLGDRSAVPPPRRPAQGTPLLERAVGICQDADLPACFPWMAAALGAAYTLAGRVADAVPLLTHGDGTDDCHGNGSCRGAL